MTTATVAIDPFPYVTAGLNAAGALVNFTAAELALLNSPAMLAARKNVDEQAARDAIRAHAATALKTGDLTQVNQDLQ